MRAYEERIGRVASVTLRDVFDRSNRHEPTSTGSEATEKTNKDAVVH